MIYEIQQLLEETAIAFDKAPIKEYAAQKNMRWFYSICSTQLQQNCNLLIGFNWGAAKGKEYNPQNQVPVYTFKQLYVNNDLGSLQRIYKPLKEYLRNDDIDNCVQTNFCFSDLLRKIKLKQKTLTFQNHCFGN